MIKAKPLLSIPKPREEADRQLYGDAVEQDIRQLKSLMTAFPDLDDRELAARMPCSIRELRKMKRRIG